VDEYSFIESINENQQSTIKTKQTTKRQIENEIQIQIQTFNVDGESGPTKRRCVM
jgi:hypothetical protein